MYNLHNKFHLLRHNSIELKSLRKSKTTCKRNLKNELMMSQRSKILMVNQKLNLIWYFFCELKVTNQSTELLNFIKMTFFKQKIMRTNKIGHFYLEWNLAKFVKQMSWVQPRFQKRRILKYSSIWFSMESSNLRIKYCI